MKATSAKDLDSTIIHAAKKKDLHLPEILAFDTGKMVNARAFGKGTKKPFPDPWYPNIVGI